MVGCPAWTTAACVQAIPGIGLGALQGLIAQLGMNRNLCSVFQPRRSGITFAVYPKLIITRHSFATKCSLLL